MLDRIGRFFSTPEHIYLTISLFVIGLLLVLVVPILSHIPGHPDEHQFFNNAWNMMAGKQLHNYIHVALTEYLLAGYLAFMNIFTRSGVNFPQGDPGLVAYYFGRIFGLIVWLTTYITGVSLLMKGRNKIPASVVFFTVLLFGSIGMFERFLRVNSDSMGILVTMIYLLISITLHYRKKSPFLFFITNLIFVFLISFTNLKALYMGLPIFALNTVLPFVYEKKRELGEELPKLFRMVMYTAGTILGSVYLWVVWIPKPIKLNEFWYSVKHTTVASVIFDYEYPGLAHKSWLVYIYDVLAHQIDFSQVAAVLIFILVAWFIGGRKLFRSIKTSVREQFRFSNVKTGNLFPSLELILLVMAVCYYYGISSVVIHWSRWAAPLGFLVILILSGILGRILDTIVSGSFPKRQLLYVLMPLLLFLAWSVQFALVLSIQGSNYPNRNGYGLTQDNVNQFIAEKGYTDAEIPLKIGWFYGELDKIPRIDLTKLGQKGTPEIEYLVWPQWGTGAVYNKGNVDLEDHNQREFFKKYTDEVIWRFPSPISYYVHYTKWFAQRVLGITWLPETEALTETQYAILKMKQPIKPLKLHYEIPYEGMEHYYSPLPTVFSLANLKDSNIFPPCHGSPTTLDVTTGLPTDAVDTTIVSRITNMYCHTLGIRIAFKGTWKIKIEGLPENVNNEQKVYSAYPFEFDHESKTIIHRFEDTKITAAFGVATREKHPPGLKFIVDYEAD